MTKHHNVRLIIVIIIMAMPSFCLGFILVMPSHPPPRSSMNNGIIIPLTRQNAFSNNSYLDSLSTGTSNKEYDVSFTGKTTQTTTQTTVSANSNVINEILMDTPARQTLPSHLQLQAIPGKGLGVVTKVPISRHSYVGDYAGEILTADQKDRRYLASQHHLWTQDDHAWAQSRQDKGQTVTGSYVYGVTMPDGAPPIYIDAEDEFCGAVNWTRFLNHASGQNANLSPKSIHQSYDGNPRVWFVARRDIDTGEELCFDYGEDYWLPGDQVY